MPARLGEAGGSAGGRALPAAQVRGWSQVRRRLDRRWEEASFLAAGSPSGQSGMRTGRKGSESLPATSVSDRVWAARAGEGARPGPAGTGSGGRGGRFRRPPSGTALPPPPAALGGGGGGGVSPPPSFLRAEHRGRAGCRRMGQAGPPTGSCRWGFCSRFSRCPRTELPVVFVPRRFLSQGGSLLPFSSSAPACFSCGLKTKRCVFRLSHLESPLRGGTEVQESLGAGAPPPFPRRGCGVLCFGLKAFPRGEASICVRVCT